MKITDCNISREAQVMLYKLGITTTEKLLSLNLNQYNPCLGTKLQNVIQEILNFTASIKSGISDKILYKQGMPIAREVSPVFPQNVYDAIILRLHKVNSATLSKKPFSCKEGTPIILRLIESWVMTDNEVLTSYERKILYYRFVLLYRFSDIAKLINIKNSSNVNTTVYKSLDTIIRKLVSLYGSEDILDSELSTRAKNTLVIKKGIRTNQDLINADEFLLNSLGDSLSDEIVAYRNKLILKGKGINVDSDVLNSYPANIYRYILLNCSKEVLNYMPFSSFNEIGYICNRLIAYVAEDFLVFTPRERKMVEMYFEKNKGLDIIAKEFDIREVKVKQIINTAVSKVMNKLYKIYNAG